MALTTASRTDVYFLLDESGSMSSYTNETRKNVNEIMKENSDPNVSFTVIAFSALLQYGKDITRFERPEHNGTNILPAFGKVHSLVNESLVRKNPPTKIITIFVSDGDDTFNKAGSLEAKLSALGPLPINSLFFTVGVGKEFPTKLVVDVLRPLYHKGSDATPAVLPVITPAEIPWTFGQMKLLVSEEIYGSIVVPESVDETTSNQDLIRYIQVMYNKCVNKCAMSGRKSDENYTLMFSTKTAINKVSEIAKARQIEERGGSFKPLVSAILEKKVNSPTVCFTAALNAITRLNKMLDEASRGRLLSDLPDEAKKELLGRQYVEGRLTTTASKYRSADSNVTINSLKRLLENYKPNAKDSALEDSINLTTQEEYFLDASKNLLHLLTETHTIQGILTYLSFVCRTITLKTPIPTDALQMNEWLAEVCALPQVIRHMSTYDYYERKMEQQSDGFTSREETTNCLMVLGGDESSPGIFCHAQTLLLLRHPGLFVITSRLAMAGSVLFFLLGSHNKIHGWMQAEFKHVDDICKTYTRKLLENWHLYVESVTNPDFRICLVTESPKLPPQCKCPNLTKFILALYVAATGGLNTEPYAFTVEELRERHYATIVEFLARTRMTMEKCLTFDFQGEADKLLHTAWTDPMDETEGTTLGDVIMAASLTVREAKHRFSMVVELGLAHKSLGQKVTESAKLTSQPILAATYYQSTVERIDNVFHNLATICGHGDEVCFELSEVELLRTLQIANRFPSGYERFTATEPSTFLTGDEMQELASTMAAYQFRRAVLGTVDSVAERFYLARHRERHGDLARIIPAQHMERFKQEFNGLDIAKDWGVDPTTGLSKNACCSPKCSHYLELLNYADIPSVDICSNLREHLMLGTDNQPMPGFHKTVSRFPKDTPERVMAKIKLGQCLSDPRPTAADKQLMESLKREKNGQDAREFIQRCMATRTNEKKSKLIQAINTRCEDTEADTLEEDIATLQTEFITPTWPYEDFKEIFLLKYKKYTALHGDNPLFTQE